MTGTSVPAVLSVIAGALAGILSAWGIGGGTLLVVYMTLVAGLDQRTAQGVNLLYFLPASLSALLWHVKNNLVDTRLALPAVITGVVSALVVSYLATDLDTTVLRRIFGGFIVLVGLSEVFYRQKKAE